MSRRRAWRAITAWAAVACAGSVLIAPGAQAPAAGEGVQPNIILIVTDDQVLYTANEQYMPLAMARFSGGGTEFTDFIATTPLCCPARAAIATGQYSHNNGVNINDYGLLRGKLNVLPNWLRRAGYTTAHVGKFMNGYETTVGNNYKPAPGWDRWFTQVAPRRYYRYSMSRNGKRVRYGTEDRQHLTLVTTRKAVKMTRTLAERPDPFYLQLDYYAPHGGGGRDKSCELAPRPAPADEGSFAGEPLYQDQLGLDPSEQSFDEIDISDKPELIRNAVSPDPGLSEERLEKIRRRWECTLGALQSVDRGIERVFKAVAEAGELGRTVFMFTSDNGYFYGEHRIPGGKQYAYEENLHMPFFVRIPKGLLGGAAQTPEVGLPVGNIDIAPTILELAGAEPCRRPEVCRVLDGRSLVGLVAGDESGWPAERGLAIERGACTYDGIRLNGQVYLEYGIKSGEGCVRNEQGEHYDLTSDPLQLDNLFPAERNSPLGLLQAELSERTRALSVCAGIPGRDPVPESGEYCE